MANLTNGTLLLRTGTEYLLLCARALAEYFAKYQSFFNVSRDITDIYTLILVVKNTIVCYGISSLVPVSTTSQLLITLSCYSLLLLAKNCVLNFTLIWASFATVLYLRSDILPLFPVTRFVLSVITLCLAPIAFSVPCTVECVVDIFLIVHVSWYLLKIFFGHSDRVIVRLFGEITAAMILLAIDIALGAKGCGFIFLVITFVSVPYIIDAYKHGKILYFFVMLFVYCYCVYEQVLILYNQPATERTNKAIRTDSGLSYVEIIQIEV